MRSALFLIIIGLGGAAILISLGVWQMQRLAWKQGVIADIEARIGAEPVALPTDIDLERDSYLPVRISGSYPADYAIRVLVSQKDQGAGYRLISAFETQGRRVLVDRGFAPTSAKSPSVAQGEVEIVGNLQWPQEVDRFTPAPDWVDNIWFARDVPAMADGLKTEPVLVVARQVSDDDPAVTPLPVDTARIPNNHLQYAITWFSLAALWLAMTFYFIRRSRPASEG